MQATPATPSAPRYPPTLSHATAGQGPSRPTSRGYPTPSIDSSIASPPATSSVPLHQYSSLADLLQQAGYKETRVYTPEAEKIRSRIKKTLDEDNEDEINALYGTYGFDRHGLQDIGGNAATGREIRHHITEPGLPMKSSSSILRSLARQDAASSASSTPQTETHDQSWWPAWRKGTKGAVSPDDGSNASFEASTEVGPGLAKGGGGVRKVRSAWEVERARPRRAGTDSPPQEERPPRPRVPSSPSDVITSSAVGYTYTPTKQTTTNRYPNSMFASPPPPVSVDEDAYGYSPLPDDYEDQCSDDEAMYALATDDYTDLYSLGSGSASDPASAAASYIDSRSLFSSGASDRSRTRSETEERAVREIQEFQDEMALIDEVNQVGQRILQDAVDYDDVDFDSPDSVTVTLPVVEDDIQTPMMPPTITPPPPNDERPEGNNGSSPIAEPVKKPLKYGDRATRLRIAHSTPALRQAAASAPPLPEGWLGAIKSAFGRPPVAIGAGTGIMPAFTSKPKGPIKISPITPALPTLVTASPVICDSISTEAEDLPPVPTPRVPVTGDQATGGVSTFALRLRPSIAKLRNVVLGAAPPLPVEDNSSPMLSPRLDWGEQGEQFAGWSPAKAKPQAPSAKDVVRDANEGGIDALFGPQPVAVGKDDPEDFDYTQSFFYKPTTPPRHGSPSGATAAPVYDNRPGMTKKRSIKSLKAALLLPVAPPAVPPVPAIPPHLLHLATPRKMKDPNAPPILAIQSPGAWVPRQLVLEGEEWDAREGSVGDWGRGRGKGRGMKGSGVRRRKSKKAVQAE
ncbi:hypothetical protein IAU60_001039 [Kwoniella sp. DSM 27419]